MAYALEVPEFVQKSHREPVVAPPDVQRKRRAKTVWRSAQCIVYLGVAGLFVSSSIPAYVQAHHLGDDAAKLQIRIHDAEQRQSILAHHTQDLLTAEGEQNAARVYGWVLKGEIAIACPRADSELSHKSDAEILAVPPPPQFSFVQRMRESLEW